MNEQVYFTCSCRTFAEDVIAETCSRPDIPLHSAAQSTRLIHTPELAFFQYQKSVSIYTGRILRHDGDIERGFQGILNVHMEAMTGLSGPMHVLGSLPRRLFDIALLWKPKGVLRRRSNFPSWSWAGWIGQIEWLSYDSSHDPSSAEHREVQIKRMKDWLTQHSWINWYYGCGPSYVWYPLGIWNPYYSNRYSKRTNQGCFLSEPPRYKYKPGNDGSGYRVTSDPSNPYGRIHEGHPRFPGLPQNTEPTSQYKKFGIDCLIFWTASARFRICSRYEPCNLNPDSSIYYDVLDSDDRVSGFVQLHKIDKSMMEVEQEFLLVSDCKLDSGNMMPYLDQYYEKSVIGDDGEWVAFNAMMVAWQGVVAIRAGVGRIMKKAVLGKGSGLAWKEIVLA
jgi:hypothetical protein